MTVCDLTDAARLCALSPRMAAAVEWLMARRGDYPAAGTRTDICPGVYVNSEAPMLLPREHARLEAHRHYIDIHVPLKGRETIGWAPRRGLTFPHGEYDGERDVEFFGDSAQCMLHVLPGQVAVFFPEDAHAPNIGTGTHAKLCVKISVE